MVDSSRKCFVWYLAILLIAQSRRRVELTLSHIIFDSRLPPVLGYSVEKDLKPKWAYLNSVSQFASFEAGRFPAYFSYPLERVIKSRYEYLRDVKRYPVQLLPLDDILRFGDNDFATNVARDDDGDNYAVFVKMRNEKLSSRKLKGHRKINDKHP